MSELAIQHDQHRNAPDLQVGDEITITVKARVYRVEEELVDITSIGQPPRYKPGRRISNLAITQIIETIRTV